MRLITLTCIIFGVCILKHVDSTAEVALLESVLYILEASAPQTVAVVAPVAATSGPAGWIITGGVILGSAIIGLIAWLFRSHRQVTDVRYVNQQRDTTTAPVYAVSAQQKRKLITTKNSLKIASFHVSCKSDHPQRDKVSKHKWNAIGIVVFSLEGKSDFYLNNIHCKSGYIVLKTDTKLGVKASETYHASCFRTVFGKSHKELSTLIAGGFAVRNGKCVFNSSTFNCGGINDRYHFGTRTMNPLIQHYIELSVKNWMDNFKQNTSVKDGQNNQINDVLCVHPDYTIHTN
eukprot:39705_1